MPTPLLSHGDAAGSTKLAQSSENQFTGCNLMRAGLAGPDIRGKSELDAYARPKINEYRKLRQRSGANALNTVITVSYVKGQRSSTEDVSVRTCL
jgi:hypothetical protein